MSYNKKTIFLFRHCQRHDDFNKDWKQNAKFPEDTPLSSYGLIQASDIAHKFQHETINHIVCSPFLRAVQTAEPLLNILNLKLKIENGLHEFIDIHSSVLIQGFKPYKFDRNYKQFWMQDFFKETRSSMEKRVLSTFKNILKLDGNIAIITHKAVYETICAYVNINCGKVSVGDSTVFKLNV